MTYNLCLHTILLIFKKVRDTPLGQLLNNPNNGKEWKATLITKQVPLALTIILQTQARQVSFEKHSTCTRHSEMAIFG